MWTYKVTFGYLLNSSPRLFNLYLRLNLSKTPLRIALQWCSAEPQMVSEQGQGREFCIDNIPDVWCIIFQTSCLYISLSSDTIL